MRNIGIVGRIIGVLLIVFLALFSSSCSKEAYPYGSVCLKVGESRVVELDAGCGIYQDSVKLLYEDTGVCRITGVSGHTVTVTGLHKGADILHIEYSTKNSKTGYSCIEIPVKVDSYE